MVFKVLETHLIPHGPTSPIWKDDYGAFAKARIESIFHEIEKVVGTISPLEIELEQKPVAVWTGLRQNCEPTSTGV